LAQRIVLFFQLLDFGIIARDFALEFRQFFLAFFVDFPQPLDFTQNALRSRLFVGFISRISLVCRFCLIIH
jgi:hypothetical protein